MLKQQCGAQHLGVGCALGIAMGTTVGEVDGMSVGSPVGGRLGTAVGAIIGAKVGEPVATVGAEVGVLLGVMVLGAADGTAVDGVAVGGVAVDGVAVDGLAVDAVAKLGTAVLVVNVLGIAVLHPQTAHSTQPWRAFPFPQRAGIATHAVATPLDNDPARGYALEWPCWASPCSGPPCWASPCSGPPCCTAHSLTHSAQPWFAAAAHLSEHPKAWQSQVHVAMSEPDGTPWCGRAGRRRARDRRAGRRRARDRRAAPHTHSLIQLSRGLPRRSSIRASQSMAVASPCRDVRA